MTTRPDWKHLDAYRRALRAVFEIYQAPTPVVPGFIACTLAVENAVILINGSYGTGKGQLVELLHRTLFRSSHARLGELGRVACHQDLTPMDSIYSLDLARLLQGHEDPQPRGLVTARLKFLNEIQRANTTMHNALLPLFAEGKVKHRSREFTSPSFVCILDANPHDSGSTEIPKAFIDRIDFSIDLPTITGTGLVRLLDAIDLDQGMHWGGLAELCEPVLDGECMEELWHDVKKVGIGSEMRRLAAMIDAHLKRCVHVDRSTVSPDYPLPCPQCSYRGDACAKLAKPPGTRFIRSTLRLAQARAWLRGVPEVEVDDLLFGLPFTLAHRLELRRECLRLYPNVAEWLQVELHRSGLRHRIPRWRQVAHLLEQGEDDQALLAELAHRDLAVASMLEGSLAHPSEVLVQ